MRMPLRNMGCRPTSSSVCTAAAISFRFTRSSARHRRTGAGVHVKTAGTTWLEELIGLAEAGGDGLELAKEIYAKALENVDAMCEPYASVIDIDSAKLPTADEVAGWSGDQYANALRHVQEHPEFNQHFRQLLHIAFKLAAKEGVRYTDLLKANSKVVGKNVTENLYDRHFKRLSSHDQICCYHFARERGRRRPVRFLA